MTRTKPHPLKVLLLDDNPDDRLLVKRALSKAFGELSFLEPLREEDFKAVLDQGGFDLVITDYQLRWTDGLKILKAVKERYPLCPVIMFTATGSEEIAVSAMKAGLDDYILKASRHFVRLPAAVQAALARAEEIRRRRQTEEELIRARREWEAIFQAIGQPAIIIDPDFNILVANKAAIDKAGGREKIVGRHCYEVFYKAEAPRPGCPVERLLSSQSLQTVTAEMKVGDKFYIISCTPLFEEGRISKIIHIATDITTQKKTEQALKEAEERYSDLLERATDLIISLSPEGRFIYVNRAGREAMGFSQAELRELSILDLVHPQARTLFKNVLKRLLRGEAVEGLSLPIIAKSGRCLELLGNLNVKMGPEGPEYIRGIFRDVTKEKEMEEERKKLQAQLLQAQKMEAIGTLAGGIAHDFNNLLMAIQGYNELAMMKTDPSSPIYRNLQQMREACLRASSLIKQLLLFTKKQALEFKPVNLNQIIRDLSEMFRRLIGENIKVELELEEDLWPIKGDTASLEQVIMNLVVNARDAMPQGGLLLIKTENLSSTDVLPLPPGSCRGNYIRLTVKDTGVGMDREVLEHIFEPFFTTKEEGKGTGLGLSVVYGIVKQHGGWVDVSSRPGDGSSFEIYLPATRAPAVKKATEEKAFADFRAKGEGILLVEDEEMVREMAADFLRDRGFNVFPAAYAREALDIFRRFSSQINILFTDVVLPDGTGLELAETLRSQKPRLKVVVTTGYTEQEIPRLEGKGKLRFLQKPYPLTTMLAVLKDLLEEEFR
ncbi:response regulator [Thermosulfuriphilus sp.]